MALAKAKIAIVTVAVIVLTGTLTTMTVIRITHSPRTAADVPNDAAIQTVENAVAPMENQAATETVPEPEKTNIAVATPKNPARPSIYSTAPRMSTILAEVKAATGGTIVPADRFYENQYGNLFQKLGLTTDQIAAFTKIVSDQRRQSAAVMTAQPFQLSAGTLNGEEISAEVRAYKEKIASSQRAIDEAADSQIKALLGSEEGLKYYQTYTDQAPERNLVINDYADRLDKAGLPQLTLDQQEQLVDMLYRARASDNRKIQFRKFPEVLQEASTFLSADQVKVLRLDMSRVVAAQVTGAHEQLNKSESDYVHP